MKTRLQIVNEAKRIRAECLDIITTAEHWNTSVRKPHATITMTTDSNVTGREKMSDETTRIEFAVKVRKMKEHHPRCQIWIYGPCSCRFKGARKRSKLTLQPTTPNPKPRGFQAEAARVWPGGLGRAQQKLRFPMVADE